MDKCCSNPIIKWDSDGYDYWGTCENCYTSFAIELILEDWQSRGEHIKKLEKAIKRVLDSNDHQSECYYLLSAFDGHCNCALKILSEALSKEE